MDKIKSITFDKSAQQAIPEEIKKQMKRDRQQAIDRQLHDKHQQFMPVIRGGKTTYFVKFHDRERKLLVHADNFTKAGILAMAYIILTEGSGVGIEYVEDLKGTNVSVDVKCLLINQT